MFEKLEEKKLNSFIREIIILLITKINKDTITDTINKNIKKNDIIFYFNNMNYNDKNIVIIDRLRSKYNILIENIEKYKNINIINYELLILLEYKNEDNKKLVDYLNIKITEFNDPKSKDYIRSELEKNINNYNYIIKLDTKINNIISNNNKNIKLDILKINNFKTIFKEFKNPNDNKENLYYLDKNNFIRFYENSRTNYNYDILELIYQKINNEILFDHIKNNINSSYIDILLINTYIHDNNIKDRILNINDYENIKSFLDDKSLFKRIYEGDIKYLLEYFNSDIENYEKIDKSLLNIIINIFNKTEIIEKIINN